MYIVTFTALFSYYTRYKLNLLISLRSINHCMCLTYYTIYHSVSPRSDYELSGFYCSRNSKQITCLLISNRYRNLQKNREPYKKHPVVHTYVGRTPFRPAPCHMAPHEAIIQSQTSLVPLTFRAAYNSLLRR